MNYNPKMHEYQKRSLKFALDNTSSYSSLDMGLGKTFISIEWCKRILPEIPGVLVVASIRGVYSVWPDEIDKWAPELAYTKLHGPTKVKDLRRNVDVYIINYEGLQWLLNELKIIFKATKKLPFRAIVLDEASKAKAHNTKRFKILCTLADAAPKYKLLLSGTPAPNSLMDLWAQYYFLDKGERLGRTITSYRDQHFNQYEIKEKKLKSGAVVKQRKKIFGYVIKEGHDDIIHERVGDITFRLDGRDYLEMPKKIVNEIIVPMPEKLRAQYTELETEFYIELENSEIEAMSAPALAMKLRQFVQGGLYIDGPKVNGERPYALVHKEKLKVLQSLVEEANGQGILCAIQFRFELDMIRSIYPDVPVIAGGTPAATTARLIEEWNRGEIPLILCHPASISDSVNLQAGSHLIVWYAITWSLYQYLQFNARVYRQGQKNAVIIHHLIMQGTVDGKIMKALKNKFKGQKALLDYLKGLR